MEIRKDTTIDFLRIARLYIRLLWNHIVFWTFPTPPEDYHATIGGIYFSLGNYGRAISAFEKSQSEANPKEKGLSKYNLYHQGYSHLYLGNFRQGIDCLKRYLILKKDDYMTISTIGGIYELLDEHEAAIESYLRALAINPDLSWAYFECSRLFNELGRKEEALAELEKANAKAESFIEKEMIRLTGDWIKGKLDRAINGVKNLIPKLDSCECFGYPLQRGDVYSILAQFERESGDSISCLSALESGLKIDPGDLWLINELALEYANQNVRLEEALNLINTALRFQPHNPIFLDTKGWVLFKMGNILEAKDIIGKSLQLYPDYTKSKDHFERMSSN